MCPVFELRFSAVAGNVTWIADQLLPGNAPVNVTCRKKGYVDEQMLAKLGVRRH
jgi:hypothetical protein